MFVIRLEIEILSHTEPPLTPLSGEIPLVDSEFRCSCPPTGGCGGYPTIFVQKSRLLVWDFLVVGNTKSVTIEV